MMLNNLKDFWYDMRDLYLDNYYYDISQKLRDFRCYVTGHIYDQLPQTLMVGMENGKAIVLSVRIQMEAGTPGGVDLSAKEI